MKWAFVPWRWVRRAALNSHSGGPWAKRLKRFESLGMWASTNKWVEVGERLVLMIFCVLCGLRGRRAVAVVRMEEMVWSWSWIGVGVEVGDRGRENWKGTGTQIFEHRPSKPSAFNVAGLFGFVRRDSMRNTTLSL